MLLRSFLVWLPSLTVASILSASSIEAPIVEVTVFPDRAVVTRAGSAALPAGVGEIVISGLPEGLIPDSLQVAARAERPLLILDVRSATRFTTPKGIDRLKPLLEQQKELTREIDQIDLTLTALRQQREFLNKIETSVTSQRTEGEIPSPEKWSGLVSFFQESLQDLLPRIYNGEESRKEVAEKLEAVNRQIAQTRGAERTRSRDAVIRFEAEEATRALFTLSYTMMNASWTPQYNVRVRSADKDVQLDYQAAVRQRTGEDWSDVHLTLSTARPSLGGTPPELHPWWIDVRRPPQPAAAPRPARQLALAEMDMVAHDRLGMDAAFKSATVESSLTAVNLRVPVQATIPADGEPHRVGVGVYPLRGDFFYTLVPKLSPHAFLQASVTHPGPAPLLGGRATIFLDGNMVGHSHLPRIEPDQPFDLPLGVDEAITVERKLLRRFVDQRGLLSKTTRTRFEFQTVITNRRATAEKLVIKDQVPVSQHDRIKIDLIELSGGKPDESAPGFYEWTRTLQPGAEIRIPLTFVVEHPEDLEISGL